MTDYEYTSQPYCPHCEQMQSDPWEVNGGEEGYCEVECEHCDKSFGFTRHISESFSTKPIEGGEK